MTKIYKRTIVAGTVIVSILFMFYLITALVIGSQVRSACRKAVMLYNSDCVSALSQTILDNQSTFADKNRAVWALGQLGDERALGLLKSYYIGIPAGSESRTDRLSQYELAKAIKLLSGGVNISALVWRNPIFLIN